MPRRPARLAALALAGGIALTAGLGGTASAQLLDDPNAAERDERCKVPPLLFQVAAIVDPDSLEGCAFFEDPNFHENRKDAGLFNDNGLFTVIFG